MLKHFNFQLKKRFSVHETPIKNIHLVWVNKHLVELNALAFTEHLRKYALSEVKKQKHNVSTKE